MLSPIIVVVLFFGFLTISGLISLIHGLRGSSKVLQLKWRGQITSGEVIKVEGDGWDAGYYTVTVRFRAPNGAVVTFTSGRHGRTIVGDRLDVRYLLNRPEVAKFPEEVSIFSGAGATYLESLLYGCLAFPTGGFILIRVLPGL